MEINDLLLFIKTEHQRLMKLYGCKENSQIKYPMIVKIMEELGELSECVLASDSMQRAEKLETQKSKIDEEVADVLITVLLLAENMHIDVVGGLKRKIVKIKKRNY